MKGALDKVVCALEEAASIPAKRLEKSILLSKAWRNPLLAPLLSSRVLTCASQHCVKKRHRPGHISLLLLEKAVDFGLGVHDHEFGDLAEEHNRAYVNQGHGAQQRQEADRRRHRKRTPQPMRRESPRRGELLWAPPLCLAGALAMALWT